MSLVPLLYLSRGQLESVDWPDPAVELAAGISKGEIKNAAVRIRYLRTEVLNNLIAKQLG